MQECVSQPGGRTLLNGGVDLAVTMLTRSVKLFVHWIYTSALPRFTEYDQLNDPYEPDGQPFLLLVSVYVFGGRFITVGFQQAVQAEFRIYISQQWHWNEDSVVAVQYATSNIAPDRPMIQLLVDDYCSSWKYAEEEGGLVIDTAFSPAYQKQLPVSFLVRVLRRFREFQRLRDACLEGDSNNRCYLEHQSDEEKRRVVACT